MEEGGLGVWGGRPPDAQELLPEQPALVGRDATRRLEAVAPHVSWGIEIALVGLIFGAVAGWISNRGLRELFAGAQPAGADETA